MSEQECVFCKIVAGVIPATEVARSDNVVAFADIAPQAPVHALVVPVEHHPDVVELAATAPQVLAELVAVGAQIAAERADGQFRLIFNTGARAGQSVFHVHGHVIAGAQLGWTPA